MKVYYAWKQLKVDYSKNILREANRGNGFVGSLGWLHISEKNIENCNSVGAWAQNIGKVVGFWSNMDNNFTDIWRVKKVKLYILKMVGLSTFKEKL